ncbi:MAG: prolyl oligopeptidase family serine peptidase, partial [Planctomycetales bacterium]|nr:prolyl oligopeptidase family serine peptidase [Planctomycetales bacterium]
WLIRLHEHNLQLVDNDSGDVALLSTDGSADDSYGLPVFWSPDSQCVVAIRTRRGGDRRVHLVESSPKDQLQPKLHWYDYLKPGDEIPLRKPQLFHVESRQHLPVSDALFPNPWNVDECRWSPDSQRFTFLYNERGHQRLRIIAIDARTGEAGVLLDETSDTFVDYAFKQFTHYADATNEIIWMSERDGWNHLYLFDSRSGALKNPITSGPWVVRKVERVDEELRQIWFQASGIFPEQAPYYIHYCRVDFSGENLVVMTRGNGTHKVQYSPDRQFVIDTYSRVDQPPIHELRRTSDGSLVCELEQADASELWATGQRMPQRFVAKGRDGETNIHGIIHRPTNFDPAKKYPVIEKIYAGPHGSFVPKDFNAYYDAQSIAELGFIVVQIDGMGTSNRSKAFHNVCWKNLGDSGFPDRILWIKAAAAEEPAMDLTRVGIYGGSAGGQSSTRALLAHGDFYHVAVSDCGCHDNRMDKIWWNELWMSWPIGPHYEEQSNVTQAHRLEGKLLLIVGELDRNVDPASTMQVANALIQADKDFDMLLIPGAGHGSAETPYGRRRRADYFVRHLLGVEPRAN